MRPDLRKSPKSCYKNKVQEYLLQILKTGGWLCWHSDCYVAFTKTNDADKLKDIKV